MTSDMKYEKSELNVEIDLVTSGSLLAACPPWRPLIGRRVLSASV